MKRDSIDKTTQPQVVLHHLYIILHRHARSVDGEIIALCVSPILVCKEIVVVGTPFIGLAGYRFSLGGIQSVVAGHDALRPLLKRRGKGYIDTSGKVAQYIVVC